VLRAFAPDARAAATGGTPPGIVIIRHLLSSFVARSAIAAQTGMAEALLAQGEPMGRFGMA